MIEVEAPDDGCLYLARVEPGHVVLSTGEELRTRIERLHALAEQLIQERVAVAVRTWWTRDGMELVELTRACKQASTRSDACVGRTDGPF